MPPAVAAIITTIASVAVTALKVSAIVKALLVIAITVAGTLLARKPTANKLNQGHELRTKFDPTFHRQVMTGLVGTGGSCHFTYTTSDSVKKPNRYLYRVIQLSDRPIHSLVRVMEGTALLHWSGDLTTGWRSCSEHTDKNGNPKLWMRVYLGSDSPTADSTLVSETFGTWTNNHKGTGLAYAIVKMDYDEDAFPSGEPEFTWIIEGAHLYDDRKDSTKSGGSGAHRLNNYSTWEYSKNAALITAQFLRGFFTNGVLIAGVQAEERDLSTTMLFSAFNTADQSVTINAGTEARYEAGLAINADEQASDILVDLQAAMDGKIFDRGGAITILPGANRTPVMDLTEEDIIWTAEKSWQPRAGMDQILNHITGNFIDSEQNFQEQSLPILSNSTWETEDGGQRFTQFFSFRAINKSTQGQRVTKRMHLATRYTGTVAFVGPIWLLELEQGDWFTLTSPRWGMTSKYFEVHEITITSDVRVAIVGREVNPAIDVWDHSVDEVPRTDTIWNPPAYDIPTPLITASGYSLSDPTTGIQTFNIVVGLSDDPALYGAIVKYIEYQYTWGDESVIANVGIVPIAEHKTTITGLAPDKAYKVRGRLRDASRSGAWTSWLTVNTPTGDPLFGYGAYLTNEAHTVAAAPDGTVASFTDAGGQFIVLKANNILTSGVVYSVFSSSNVTIGIDSGTGVYTVTAMPLGATQGTATLRAVVDGLTIDRVYSISKSIAGADGTGSFAVILTNESHNIPTDSSGGAGDYTNANGLVKVFDYTGDITSSASVTFGSVTAVGCTGTVNTATNTPVSGQPKGYYRVTNITADTAYLDIPVTVDGDTVTKRFSVTRAKAGTNGSSPPDITITADRQIITFDETGVANPSGQTINFTGIRKNAVVSQVWRVYDMDGNLRSPDTSFLTYGGSGDVITATMTTTQFNNARQTTEGVKVKISIIVSGVTYEDWVTIVKVQKGATGASAKGLSIYADRYGIGYDENGAANPAVQTTTFIAQKQNSTATVTWSVYDGNGNARTPTTSYLSAATGDTVTMTVAQFASAQNGSGSVRVVATYTDGVTLTDTVTVHKVAAGAAAIGFYQSSIPTSTFISQTWYRTSTKQWFIARSVGADAITTGEWELLLGSLSAKDIIDTADINADALNNAGYATQTGTLAAGAGGGSSTQLFLGTSFTAKGSTVVVKAVIPYYLTVNNPTEGTDYSSTLELVLYRNSNTTAQYSDVATVVDRWDSPNGSGLKNLEKKAITMEWKFTVPATNETYQVGYRITPTAGAGISLPSTRYVKGEDMRAIE